ncbi:PLP-dependent transferase [Dendrothele bispora CBS 962.96]|uniref:PLP-dependent transferase n=1 Tax=Dendrothele bispora (strain CBS 962.96) TaxID=1314807 RepID=A0A4S8LLQ9_DENBC|nr:PLP-dependent transferase [Dendrothele bispora CBS 962.96]
MSSRSSDPHPLLAPTLPLYSSTPPPLGHALKTHFSFDPSYVNLNHGSYGSLPSPVLDAIKPIAALAEANPDKFHRFEYIPMLAEVRRRLASLMSEKEGDVSVDEVVCVPNASHGISTVLRNFIWEEGDIVIDCNTTYGSVGRTVQYLNDVPPHPKIAQFTMLFPTTRTKILEDWRLHVRAVQQTRLQNESPTAPTTVSSSNETQHESGTTQQSQQKQSNTTANKKLPKVVAIIDSIISVPGVSLPWAEMVQILREECGGGEDANVWSVIDAAHSIGQEVTLPKSISLAQPDFLITNCHKWLFTKRSCAVLYVPKRNQHVIKTTFPTSATYIPLKDRKEGGEGFADMFTWTGTIDFIPYLSAAHALHFRSWLGGERVINEYCRKVGREGAKKMSEILGTEEMDPKGEYEFNMVNVALPLPSSKKGPDTGIDIELLKKIDGLYKQKMILERNMFSPAYWHNGKWWTRCSAQVWVEVEDFEKVALALKEVCKEIVDELGLDKE